jgi:hypothetical protein
MSGAEDQGQPPIGFTLDGVEHTSPVRRLIAGEVLQKFGGLNPADYDLIRIEGQGHEQRYKASDEIELVPGGRYVSFFTGPMPVE